MKISFMLALVALTAVTMAPMVAAEDPDDPPEGCTVKVLDERIIYHPLTGRPWITIPETWICPG